MKKLHIITVALLVVGAVSSWAQVETDRIVFGPVPITFKGKLSDGTAVTGATLNEGDLEFAAVQLIGPEVTRSFAYGDGVPCDRQHHWFEQRGD